MLRKRIASGSGISFLSSQALLNSFRPCSIVGRILCAVALIFQIVAFAPEAFAQDQEEHAPFTLTDEDKKTLEDISGHPIKLGYFGAFGYYEDEEGKRAGHLLPLMQVLEEWGLQVIPEKVGEMTEYHEWAYDDIDIYSSVTLTRDLADTYACSDTLYQMELLAVRPLGETLESLTDLSGQRIGILPEPGIYEALSPHLEKGQEPITYTTVDSLLSAVDSGEVDVAVCSLNIQGDVTGYAGLSYQVLKGAAPSDKGVVATAKELRPLIELIDRYIHSEEGPKLSADTTAAIDAALIKQVKEKLQEDIAVIQENYDSVGVLGSESLYPYSFRENDHIRGIMPDSIHLFEQVSGIPVEVFSPDSFSSTDEIIAAQEDGRVQMLAGVRKSSNSVLGGSYSVPVLSDKERLYKRVDRDLGKRTVRDLSVGVCLDMYPNVEWQMFFGDYPISYVSDGEVLAALDRGEIDLALISEMSFDYATLIQHNYYYEQFDSTEIDSDLCLNFSANNLPELNRVMNEVIALYNSSYAYQGADWSREAVDYQQEYIRAQEDQQFLTAVFGLAFALLAILLFIVLVFAIFEYRKYSSYDRQVRQLIEGQDMMDIGFGDFKKNIMISKGDWPLMRKIGMDLPHKQVLPFDLLSKEYGFNFRERYWTTIQEMRLKGERMLVREIRTGRKDRWISIRQHLHIIDDHRFSFYTIDITNEKAKMADLKEQADFDNLTGIYRRRAFTEICTQLQQEYESASYIAIFDIDLFKNVNDNFGHDVGDKVIRMVADTLRECFNETCCVGRWGGEEFLALFCAENQDQAIERVQEVLCAVEGKQVEIGDSGGKMVSVTVSAGVAEWLEEDTLRSVVSKADTAMYDAKRSGRNCVRYYEE